ncbi:hypothetical protein KP509_08G027700 [Ceratopteris richardii]|uniref:Protein kinase domain-containing protein n=1 Tax=Ceratopteris richardii TaxID=49495 RepID=A0A8T2UAZ6_CERRI|nr:hypothetical protein KP509_08G027700 [Ceratopteris richardii]
MQLVGEGQYGMIHRVKISHPRINTEVFVAKLFKLHGANIQTRENEAINKATVLSFMHSGIISPLGLARDHSKSLCLIFKFSNGGTLDMWLERMKKEYLDVPQSKGVKDTEEDITTVKTNIWKLINGLLQTIPFLHTYNISHNDLPPGNILLHFENQHAYIGLCDFGRVTYLPTKKKNPKLPNLEISTRNEWIRKYWWITPECISTSPPHSHKSQEIFIVSILLLQLLKYIDFNSYPIDTNGI